MMNSVEKMIEQYVHAWNMQDLDTYRQEFAKCWAPDGVYIDPTSSGIKGVEGITMFAFKSLDVVPERKFDVLEQPEHHHGLGKYTWKVTLPGGCNVGYDYFEFNEEFKITRLVSFFKLPDNYPIHKVYG